MNETRLDVTKKSKEEWLLGCSPESRMATWFCATQRARLAAERLEKALRALTRDLRQDVSALTADPESNIDKYSGKMLTRDAFHASRLAETLIAAAYEIEQALKDGENDEKKEENNTEEEE